MRYIFLLLLSFPVLSYAGAVSLSAAVDKSQYTHIDESYDMANINGTLEILSYEEDAAMPTRVVIGITDGDPTKHAFRLVFERIKDSDKFWLAYEYLREGTIQIRIDIESGIKINQPIPFDVVWHKSPRMQVAVFETAHFPYTALKAKKPYFQIVSGAAKVDYKYRQIQWLNGVPPN